MNLRHGGIAQNLLLTNEAPALRVPALDLNQLHIPVVMDGGDVSDASRPIALSTQTD
jgi:hypothetical protein